MKQKANSLTSPLMDYAVIFLGNLLFASSISFFSQPLSIPLGGVNGIAQIINFLSGFPLGFANILLNVPLFIMAYRSLGRRFLFRTAVATLCSSLLVDAISQLKGGFLFTQNTLLAALYAGVLSGLGLGLVFTRAATTGGSDIISKLLNKRYPFLSIGRVNMVFSAFVIIAAAIVFKTPEAALLAIVMQFVSSTMIDTVIGGFDNGCMSLIITKNPQDISDAVLRELNRGCTGIPSHGMYTKSEQTTLIVVARSHEVSLLKLIINKTDPDAFVIQLNAREVFGRGFKRRDI